MNLENILPPFAVEIELPDVQAAEFDLLDILEPVTRIPAADPPSPLLLG